MNISANRLVRNSDVILENRVLVSRRLESHFYCLGLGTQSLGLGLVLDLDPSSLGSWSRKFGTMYETRIFPKRGHFPRITSFSGFLGYTGGTTIFILLFAAIRDNT